MSAEAKLAWVMLICHVKGHGFGGVCKAVEPAAAARVWFMGEESVRQMLIAAQTGGALVVTEGEWTVLNWRKYQGDETNSERQSRWREKQKRIQNHNEDNALVTKVTLTETETVKETTNVVSSRQKRSKAFVPPKVEEVAAYMASRGWANSAKRAAQFVSHYETSGWVRGKGTKITNWKACVVTWEQREGFDFKSGQRQAADNYRGAYE